MAAPPNVTTIDLNGKFAMNKTLSDPTEEILKLQGVTWVIRKALSMGRLMLFIKQYKDDDGVEHIIIDQTLASIPGTKDEYILNWEPKSHEDHVFGAEIGRARRIKVEDIEDHHLKQDWLPDTLEHGVVHEYVESDTPKNKVKWIAEQTWGFEVVQGERRHTRRVKFQGPKGEVIRARLVYDYLGPA